MTNNILKITFDASTINGTIIKNLNYTPSMSNPQIHYTYHNTSHNILFIPSIKLRRELFDSNDENHIKQVFLSPAQMNNFIERLQEKKMYQPISIAEARKKGIIYNNIKFVLDLFFKKNDSLYIYQTQYIINSYKWNNKYNLISVPGQKTPIVKIKIEFVLHKGNKMSFVESTRLTCLQKKNDIVNDYYNLVGLNKPVGKTAPLSEQPVEVATPISMPNYTPMKKVTTTTTYYGGYRARNTSRKHRPIRNKTLKKRH